MSQASAGPDVSGNSRPAPIQIPWEDPAQPRLSGLVLTLRDVLRHPGKFFDGMPRQGWAEALTFGVILGSFGLLASTYFQLLLRLALSQKLQELPGLSSFIENSTSTLLAFMILTPGIILVSLLVGSGCLWGVLRLMGVAADFSPALRINCYAQGALVAAIIPLLGSLAAIFWNIYLTCKGVQRVFGLTSGRALAAVFLSLALEAFLFLLLMVGLGLLLVAHISLVRI